MTLKEALWQATRLGMNYERAEITRVSLGQYLDDLVKEIVGTKVRPRSSEEEQHFPKV